jgi:branched-chain amino acid transport system ATP-binding protein
MLKVEDLRAGYGQLEVLHGVSLDVARNELVALIGANGAGKTTMLRAIMGLSRPTAGKISLEGEDITGVGPEKIAHRGVALVPEGRRIFPGLTVRENLQVAHAAQRRPNSFSGALEEVVALFPSLKMRISSPGWSLSGGEQQMLAIGRAIIARPSLILLDEPSMGLAPKLVHDAFASLRRLNEAGATILLVEQNAYQALKVANRCFVLENGRVTHSGPAHQLRNHPDIVRAFLGA